MWSRIASFLLCQLACAALCWAVVTRGTTFDLDSIGLGLIFGGILWFLLDLMRGLRVLAWIRQGDSTQIPVISGLWGEVADRVRRQLRVREKLVLDAQSRLQEFLAAIQASPNGVVLLDVQGRIEWCNQTAAEHFGFDAQRDMLQLIGNLVRDPIFAGYYASGVYNDEVMMDGRRSTLARPVKLSVQLHPYGDGRRLLLSRDTTALEQAEIMRRDFVANVSHEIRTPLTVLAGFVETLQTLPLTAEEQTRYLGLMAQQSLRMQHLVNDLLTLSRLEGSPLPSAQEWMPAKALIEQCQQESMALANLLGSRYGKAHELRFVCEGESMEIAGSQTEIISAMSNLVSNALRYTPSGGVVSASWRLLADGCVEFSVNDTGPGIADEHLSRLTERFYRVDRSRSRETGGTGLGLAIVKHVVQRHGGELTINSSLGVGSTFTLHFPASRVRQQLSPQTLLNL
jgi:two-component system, OmpR family, phosphate regulon sensor histidine kinase PhoR